MLWTANDCFIQSRSAADFLVNIQLFFLYVIAATPQFFMDKSIINRGEPCSAMWLFWTITKCCYWKYRFLCI